MNPETVNKQIANAEKAKKKSEGDLKIITETIAEGCPNCRLRSNETLPAQPEVDFSLLGLVPDPNSQPL